MNKTEDLIFKRSVAKLNWLRAGVLGINDGLISVAGIVVGVAGATTNSKVILTSGIAGIVAGALSMAIGEYVSVSSQRDNQKTQLETEKKQIEDNPEAELEELTQMYQAKGLTRSTAETVATELTKNDAFAAHVHIELNIDPDDLNNPWQAALASTTSFTIGSLVPLLVILLSPHKYKIIFTFIGVLIALFITGMISAKIGESSKRKATLRVVIGGAIAMAVTYGIGSLIHLAAF